MLLFLANNLLILLLLSFVIYDHLSPSACWNCHAMPLFRTRLVLVFSFSGLPSPPLTPSYNVSQYGRDSVMLTVQWQPSQDDGGAPVNYTITASPGPTEVTTSSTSASLPTIPYNVTNTISIVATNCIGNSSVVMQTIRIGKLQCSLWSTLYLEGRSDKHKFNSVNSSELM